jgi:hypothetical protein
MPMNASKQVQPDLRLRSDVASVSGKLKIVKAAGSYRSETKHLSLAEQTWSSAQAERQAKGIRDG